MKITLSENVDFSYNHFNAWHFFITCVVIYFHCYSVLDQLFVYRKKAFILWPTSWWHYLECSLHICFPSQLLVYKSIQQFTSLCSYKKLYSDNWWRCVLYKYFAIVYYNAINESKKNETIQQQYQNRSLL